MFSRRPMDRLGHGRQPSDMARLSTVLVLVSLALLSSGCRRRARPDQAYVQPGTPRVATQTTYSYVGGERESTPLGLPHESIVDEATLYVGPNQTCANVVLRQPLGFDEPSSQLAIRCSADGRSKDNGWVSQEQPSGEQDYPFQGAPPMLKVRGPHGWVQFPIGAAQQNVFRVVQRSFQVCCPFGAQKVFRLTLSSNARFGDYVRTDFGWKLNAGARLAPQPQPQPIPASQGEEDSAG